MSSITINHSDKEVFKRSRIFPIFCRDAARNLIGDVEQINIQWAKYFEELLSAPYIAVHAPLPLITLEKVIDVLALRSNRVPSIDKIPAELLKVRSFRDDDPAS